MKPTHKKKISESYFCSYSLSIFINTRTKHSRAFQCKLTMLMHLLAEQIQLFLYIFFNNVIHKLFMNFEDLN